MLRDSQNRLSRKPAQCGTELMRKTLVTPGPYNSPTITDVMEMELTTTLLKTLNGSPSS